MTKRILKFYANVEKIVNGLVSLIVNIFMFTITTLAPAAAPIAPAFSVYKALTERLNAPLAIALAGSIAIEITGMFVSKTAVRAANWNSGRNKTDPEAPRGLAITMAAVFFFVIFVLSLTIELKPALAVWVYPGFVIVAITVYVCLAISNNLTTWETTKASEAEQRAERNGLAAAIREAKTDLEKLTADRAKLAADIDRQKRNLAQLTNPNAGQNGRFSPINGASLDKANEAKQDKIAARRANVLDLKLAGLTNPEIAARLSVSVGTVKNDVKSLNGKLEEVNNG